MSTSRDPTWLKDDNEEPLPTLKCRSEDDWSVVGFIEPRRTCLTASVSLLGLGGSKMASVCLAHLTLFHTEFFMATSVSVKGSRLQLFPDRRSRGHLTCLTSSVLFSFMADFGAPDRGLPLRSVLSHSRPWFTSDVCLVTLQTVVYL